MQKMRLLKWTLFLSCFFIFLHQNAYSSIDSTLKNIPFQDRFYLSYFFRDIFLHDSIGHVVFFNTKPAALVCFCEEREQHFLEKLSECGWKKWKKYESFFPHPHFIFTEETVNVNGRSLIHIFLINKKSLEKCLRQYQIAFEKILGESFDPTKFMLDLEREKALLSLIKFDECLLGIILGYGYEASLAFCEQHKHLTESDSYPAWTDKYQGIDLKEPKRSLIFPVGFMGDPNSEEVQELKKKYESELHELWAKYKRSRNTLKLVLEQLCAS